jgi:hypothetical protein
MIRIRYKDLPAGLHGSAERSARRTTVYLLPGLTGEQRRAALRRLRQEASRDCGPALPLPQLVVALGVDRTREAVRGAAAVIRLHPAAIVLPTIVTGTLMALFVLGSVRIVHLPVGGVTAESPPQIGHSAALPPSASAPAGKPRTGAATGGGGGSTDPGSQRNSATWSASSSGSADGSGGAGLGTGTPASTATPAARPTGSGTASPSATGPVSSAVGGVASAAASAAGAGSVAAGAASAISNGILAGVTSLPGGGGQAQVCVNVGLFGVCLGI